MKEANSTRYRSVAVSSDHPLAQDGGNGYWKIYEHRLVLFDKIGPWDHLCHWCNRLLQWSINTDSDSIVVDHLDGNEWNNAPDNLVPSCRRCNVQRSIRPDFLTCCPKGHEYAIVGLYIRLDGGGRVCKGCMKERDDRRNAVSKEKRAIAKMKRKQL